MSISKSNEQKVFSDKLHTLYSSNKISTAATLTVAVLYVMMQLPVHGKIPLLLWLSLLAVIYACRFVLTRSFFRQTQADETLFSWLQRFRVAVTVTGLTLGSTVIFFYPSDDVPLQMFTVLMLAGLAAGGLTVLVADLVTFTAYVCSLLLPVVVTMLCTGEKFYLITGLLVFIYLLIIIRASRRLNDIVSSSLTLRYENLALLQNIEKEKNQLSNRLGRIFNDSSNELYIAEADSLRYLQVNKGALQNLGYSREELYDMTIFDVIVDLDEQKLRALCDPLQSGSRDVSTYKTLHRRKDGSTYPAELCFQFSTQEDPAVFVVTALDITDRDEAERKLIHQANYDQLTNLPNRYHMLSRVDRAFARARRRQTRVALIFMDLDNFKDINDTLGHAIGDKLLTMVAERISSVLREVDTPARLGGDEFLIMLEDLDVGEQAEIVIHKLNRQLKEPFIVDSHEIYTKASMGVSMYPDNGESVDLLMQYADAAMYHAKQDDSCNYRFFSPELRASINEQLAIESQLRHAIKNNELSVVYQAKIDTFSGRVVGAEALLRWHNAELGAVPPNVFVPVAEKYGLIEDIGSWVLQHACEEAVTWKDLSVGSLHLAVNISPQQFRSRDFLGVVDRVLAQTEIPTEILEFEITENLLMQDTKEPLEILTELRRKNIILSLDDFGTGYSSLRYLKQFPIQVLKIDRSFVRDMMENQYNRSLVDAIIAMAKSLELSLVAEGVETEEQLAYLRKHKVETIQGYLFSPPISAEEFRSLVVKMNTADSI